MELTANFQVANQLGSSMSMPSIINGEDGVTPQLRINEETNLWEVSYDDGATWESLGVKATGAEISTVEQITTSDEDGGENVVRITLTDGRTFDFTTKNGSKGSKGDTGNGIIETIVVDDAVNQKKIVTLTYTDGTSESFDVPYGKDGVSVTHEWEGTTLKVTSASGTSSVDLKGEQGNTPYIKDDYWWIGETNTGVKAKGEDGSGHTPVKGVDYWTEEDKAEMKEFVKNELPTEVSAFNNDAGYLTEVPSEYITEEELNSKGYLTEHQSLEGYAKTTDVPTKVSQLENDKNYLTEVPSEYVTEEELTAKGYLTEHQSLDGYAKTDDIPTKVSELENDKNYLTEIPSEYVTEEELEAKKYLTAVPDEYVTESELEGKKYLTSVPEEYVTEDELNNKGYLTSVPDEYVTEDELNAKGYLTEHQSLAEYPKTTEVESKISTHNTNTEAHSDIRILLQELNTKITNFLDSDDETLDELSEIITLIKENQGLIAGITTTKVSYTDIVDNLTTALADKPLSANQGVVLKALIDDLTNDKLSTSDLNTAIDSALATAKESGEFDGSDGEDGKTPYILDGYWYIGETNTGVKAEGTNGLDGVFIGTQTAYEEAYSAGLIPVGCIVIIDEASTTAVLGKAILGKMVLGTI